LNLEALLAAAKELFSESGTDAPLEDVARRAGVGQGTLYRHFPTREHLFVELMRERESSRPHRAGTAQRVRPMAGPRPVLRLYDRSAAEYRGMSMRVAEGLADDTSPVAAAYRVGYLAQAYRVFLVVSDVPNWRLELAGLALVFTRGAGPAL
jgi:AcrR family transcriptional regulator